MTRKELLQQFVDSLITDIQQEQKDKGIRASGQSADSLRGEANGRMATVLGAEYFEFQRFGRGPGKRPPRGRLEKWIIDRGILLGSVLDAAVKSLAYVFGTKIKERGTNIYEGKSRPLDFEKVIEPNLGTLRNGLIIAERTEVRSGILRGLEQALNQ